VLFFTILLTASAHAQDFAEANRHYREGRFKEAAAIYERLAEENPRVAAHRYNLGNSLYRSGRLGEAILSYEKALLLAPRDSDIRSNLYYAKSLLEYRVEDKRNWYLKAGEAFLKYWTWEEILFAALVFYFLFISSVAVVLFFRRGLPWGSWRKTLLICAMVVAAFAVVKNLQMNRLRDAVVLAQQAEVRYGPSETDQIAFRLGEGLSLYVVDRREDWSRILLVNGETGWVSNDQIAEVRQ
jgi:tetratricopeptide (TPR) repeat protein